MSLHSLSPFKKITRRTIPFTFKPPVFAQKIPFGNFSSKKRSGIAVRVGVKGRDLASGATYDA